MARQLLLVGWEAADWRVLHPLIDAGEMPVLRRIIEAGPSGQLFRTQPPVSVAQWTTIATGKRPWQHQVCHPLEKINAANKAVSVNAAGRRSLAIWDILAQAGKRSLVVGWPATHGGQIKNGVIVSDHYALPTVGPGIKPWPPAAPGTYCPEEIGGRLDRWRISPEEIQADVVSPLVPEWKQVDQKRDRRLGQLRLLLARDFSHQAALMTLLVDSKWDFAAVHFPALGAMSQFFLAHHFSQPGEVSEPGGRRYQNVIRGACHLLDQMLGKLVQAVGDQAAIMVVSGHGVAHRHRSRGRDINDEAWKSAHGIFAARGPALARDTLVFGATVLDVAPTILAWFGLPIGDDMEGRVLSEGFVTAPAVAHVPTWEGSEFVALPPADKEPHAADHAMAAAILRREWDWNLAQSYLDAARYEAALPILERVFRGFPERPELGYALFQCQLALRKSSDAAETLEVILEGIPDGVSSRLARAELFVVQRRIPDARRLVNEAWQLHPTHPDEVRRIGLLLLQLRDWNALAKLASRSLERDDTDALAWLGLAEAQLRQRLGAEAEAAALRAIGLNFYLSDAHFVLARARVAQGKWHQARSAMQTVLQLQPNRRAAATYARRMASPRDG